MRTQRLDWLDPYRLTFDATIIERLTWQGQPALVLDQTCFYPTSGGQPHDTGTLDGARVVDVVEDEQGRVIHVVDALPEGEHIIGKIDWPRRLDHMQQHTGQHVLSAAFQDELGAATLSFHLGPELSTIDIALASATLQELERVEERANTAIWLNLPVMVEVCSAEMAAKLPLRKAPVVNEDIRVVMIQGTDVSACCGTHVRATGELGQIHIRRATRQNGNLRVEFLVGRRALHDFAQRDHLLQQASAAQSVAVLDLPDAQERLIAAEAEARHQAEMWRKRWLDMAWPSMADEAEQYGGLRLVCNVLEDLDAGNMRYLAQQIITQPGYVALLAVNEPSPQVCFARSDDLDIDMGQLLRQAAQPLGGRGGGRPNMAQGGGVLPGHLSEFLRRAQELLGVTGKVGS